MKERSLALGCFVALLASAQNHPALPAGYNYSEANVPAYQMLDPLRDEAGGEIKTRAGWKVHRVELIAAFEDNVFGRTPESAQYFRPQFRLVEPGTPALGGLAMRRQVLIPLGEAGDAGPAMHLLLYLPAKHRGPVPVILGLNFQGNAAIDADPGIQLTPVWEASKVRGEAPHQISFPPERRGTRASEWQAEMILRRGYGLATVYYGDIDPDFKNAETLGVRGLYAKSEPASAAEKAADNAGWGSLSAWAWGLSRALDYLVTDPAVNKREIAVTGHSRLGKAADWAAAQDTRFAALLSTESGKGGQSLFHREFGETIQHLQHSFPYWFCPEFAQWVGRDREIPVDGNLLLALIAPRPLYVASAEEDLFSDPRGEFLSAADAGRVYALFGEKGLGTDAMPPVNQPIMHDVAYHVRSGVHDVTAFDWEQYLNFLDMHFGSPLENGKTGSRERESTH